MKINFEVGTGEKHNIEFLFNTFLGTITLKVDGKVESRSMMVLGGNKIYSCMTGEHSVNVEIVQGFFAGAFRKRTYNAYVAGNLYKTFNSREQAI